MRSPLHTTNDPIYNIIYDKNPMYTSKTIQTHLQDEKKCVLRKQSYDVNPHVSLWDAAKRAHPTINV